MATCRPGHLRRPTGAPPTESLLETLAVQLARTVPGLGDPVRQLVVEREGLFVARVDLAWLCARFTWREITVIPHTTARRLAEIVDQCRKRPVDTRSRR
jgi:hypothetical protein